MSRIHFPDEEKKHETAGRHPAWNDVTILYNIISLMFAIFCMCLPLNSFAPSGVREPRDATGCHLALALGEGFALRTEKHREKEVFRLVRHDKTGTERNRKRMRNIRKP